jgi:outer membrane protein assembly factor BamB
MRRPLLHGFVLPAALLLAGAAAIPAGDAWPQFKYDARHSGNVAGRELSLPLRLVGAVPLTDAALTAPVVADGRVYVVDGSGVAFCCDAQTLAVLWKLPTRGGKANCNNVSSPALAGRYLHFGTTAGAYYVIEAASGKVVREIDCGEPILSTPVVGPERVYFATLGSRVYSLRPDGTICWTWDFVRERLGFHGDRWSGRDWLEHLKGRVTSREQFLCSRDMALDGNTLVVPAGGFVVWLEDAGRQARLRRLDAPQTATFALSIGEDGTVYRQSHWLDNGGQVEILRRPAAEAQQPARAAAAPLPDFDAALERALVRAKEGVDYVAGTRSSSRGGLLSFSSVSLRGGDVYRCRPEEGYGFCRHSPAKGVYAYAGCYPSMAPPVLLRDQAVYGGLDGALYVVPLAGGRPWSFATPFGKAISAPVAVCDGRVWFCCEDGYLYALGPGGKGPLPARDLQLAKIRSPLAGPLAGARYDRFTSFADWGNTNAGEQPVGPPFKLRWIRRYDGTAKHFSTFGEGRMYTHTAEGQIFAVEQETGRLLWRRYFPGVHISYTSPLYYQGRLLVPQAGISQCVLRCLDAANGSLRWEAPFSGSPSWNRQLPPVVCKNRVIYMFGTGKYGPDVPPQEQVKWLFGHQNVSAFPRSHRPLVRAYDLDSGREAWSVDFSQYGSGGDDAGVCLLDGTVYYSCYFGRQARLGNDRPGPHGVTAALDPQSGKILWLTTKYSVHGGCTISGAAGRLYLGGYNPLEGTQGRHVWCLDAKDGSLVWQSEPLREAIHVATLGAKFIFIHAQYKNGYLLDKQTGKILATLTEGYKCSRFTLSGTCLMGPSMDVVDLADPGRIRLLSSGPRLDPSDCIGGCVSNGRIFYTGHGGGLQACQACGPEASAASGPWLGRSEGR